MRRAPLAHPQLHPAARAAQAALSFVLLPLLLVCCPGFCVSAPPAQGVPENITVTFLNPSSVRVSWATAADGVDKYDVTYKPTDASYRVVAVVAGNSDAVTLSGLRADTQYQVTVAAVWGGHKFRSRPIVFRTLEPPRTSPQQDPAGAQEGATTGATGGPPGSSALPDPSPTFPTIRGVEVGIVVLVLMVWVGAIALFFNRWGKIRMLLPYQPDYKQEQLKVPGTGACAAAGGSVCGGNHGTGPACSQHLHWTHSHGQTQSLELDERDRLAGSSRPRVNSAIFASAEQAPRAGFAAFDAGDFLRRYGSQSKLCRKARSADNIPLTSMEEGSCDRLYGARVPREETICEEPSKNDDEASSSSGTRHFGLPILSVSGPSPPEEDYDQIDEYL